MQQELSYAIKGHGVTMKTNMFCVRDHERNGVIFADSELLTDQLESYKFAPWHEVSVESPCVRKVFARDTPILILKDDVLDSVPHLLHIACPHIKSTKVCSIHT